MAKKPRAHRMNVYFRLGELVDNWQRAEKDWHEMQDAFDRVRKSKPSPRLTAVMEGYSAALLEIARADEALRKWRR